MSAINSSMGPPTPTPKRQISESDSELDITNVVKKNKVGRRSTEEIVDDKIKKMTEELMKVIASKDVIINGLIERIKILEEKDSTRNQSGNILDTTENLVEKVKLIESSIERIDKLEKHVKTMNDNGNLTESPIASDKLSEQFWAKLDKQKTFELTKAINEETSKIKKKENNVIIFGVPINKDSIKLENSDIEVKHLFKELEINNITFKQTKRLKSKDGKTGPIIVELNNLDDRIMVLKASHKIKKSKPNIFINKDLTNEELTLEKKLRKERSEKNRLLEHSNGNLKYGFYKFNNSDKDEKFYWGIRNGKIKRIKILENEIEMTESI